MYIDTRMISALLAYPMSGGLYTALMKVCPSLQPKLDLPPVSHPIPTQAPLLLYASTSKRLRTHQEWMVLIERCVQKASEHKHFFIDQA